MIEYALAFGFIRRFVGLADEFWRLATGPALVDRVLAVDTMVINSIALDHLVRHQGPNRRVLRVGIVDGDVQLCFDGGLLPFLLSGDVIE
jgi:multicomponent K+:H+ antiporter subunit F